VPAAITVYLATVIAVLQGKPVPGNG